MATPANLQSGVLAQEVIANDSLYVQSWLKPSANGRKSLISCEFMDHSKDNLIGLTQVDKSMFILLPTYYPEIYTDVPNGAMLNKAFKGYWNYICQTATSVDGIQDISFNIQNATYKTQFFSTPLFTTIEQPTNEISLRVPAELSGYFITKQTRHWMNAISDEQTRVATYNGLDEDFNNWSHSAGMLYIKPNKTLTKCDYVALWFLMVPKQAQISNFNADATSPQIIEMNLTFHVSVIDDRNIRVKELGEEMLRKYKAFLCEDTALFGIASNTVLHSVEDLRKVNMLSNLTSL
nr:MAG TPA: hypothetical protein [Caudoviricetes sp.]